MRYKLRSYLHFWNFLELSSLQIILGIKSFRLLLSDLQGYSRTLGTLCISLEVSTVLSPLLLHLITQFSSLSLYGMASSGPSVTFMCDDCRSLMRLARNPSVELPLTLYNLFSLPRPSTTSKSMPAGCRLRRTGLLTLFLALIWRR